MGSGGYVGGGTQPIRSETEIRTYFKMWLRNSEGRDYSYETDWDPGFAIGQRVSVVFLDRKPIFFVNENTSVITYLINDQKMADMINGYNRELCNKDALEFAERMSDGAALGIFLSLVSFFLVIFVEDSQFFWIDAIGEPHS